METSEVVSMKGNHMETRWKLLSGFNALEIIWKLSTCSFRMVSTGFPFHGNSFFRAVKVCNVADLLGDICNVADLPGEGLQNTTPVLHVYCIFSATAFPCRS